MLFTRGPQVGLRLTVLIFLSIVLMLLDHRQHYLVPVHNVLSGLVAPLQYAVDAPRRLFENLNTYLTSKENLLIENASLRTQQIILKTKLQKLTALQQENTELRALLTTAKRDHKLRVVVAELLAVDTDPLVSEVVLDKGQNADIYVGQPVLDAAGVMGQVIQVGPLTSRVLLINDLRSAVPVQDARNGVRGLVVGQGRLASLLLTDVAITADIKIGDSLITSGLGGRYPSGYPVGVVTNIYHAPHEQSIKIEISPSARLNQNQQVLLIWPSKKIPIDAPKIEMADATHSKIK